MSEERSRDLALLVLRLAAGAIIGAHGLQKVFGLWGGPGIENFAGFMQQLGFTPPEVWAWIAGLSETVGGMFLVLGVLPRLSAAFIAATMAVAIYKVHWGNGLFAANNGFEYPLLILCVCLSLILSGGGRFSLFNRL
jgi:putative oxidoreductase